MKNYEQDRKSRIHQQLGTSHGAATGKLRKRLLFKYIAMAGDNICYRCGDEINSVDDMSIEHIKPWENRDPSLFWDLDNIAFSHISCNRPHATGRVDCKEGYSLCSDCKREMPVKEFHVDRRRWNGASSKCKDCRNEYKRRKWRESR